MNGNAEDERSVETWEPATRQVKPGETAALEDAYVPSRVERAREQFFVISGCSGSGKSSLLAALARRGYLVVPEPGRQVIREQAYIDGDAVPGRNVRKFLEFTISRTMHQMIVLAETDAPVFFDRSIVDQVAGFSMLDGAVPASLENAVARFRYHHRVFVTPPWPEIFRNDAERTHSLADAVALYEIQLAAYRRYGYEPVFVPQIPVAERAEFVLRTLALA